MNALIRQRIRELRDQGMARVEDILRRLTEPTVIRTPTTATRRKTPEQKAFIAATVAASLATRAELRDAADPGALVLARMKSKVETGPANERTVATRECMPALLAYLAMQAKGGRAAATEDDETETGETQTPGPSWLETNAPDEEAPSLHQIRKVLENAP